MPSYHAGDTLQWAVLARASTLPSSTLNIGVQSGGGDENTLSVREELKATAGDYKWILSSPRPVNAVKPNLYLYIPYPLGQQIDVKELIIGDPISVAFHTAPTVVIGGIDTEVPNTDLGGETILEKVATCRAEAETHGGFVSCVAKLTNALKKANVLSDAQKGAIQSAAAQSE